MAPRTIDNLGVDASSRYAADQQRFDKKILKESRVIPRQAEVDVTMPSFSSEFDLLFDSEQRNTPWAKFCMPRNYNEQRKRLFTYQIIPSLGPQDKTENQEKKILAHLKERAKHQDEKGKDERQNKEGRASWEESQAEAEQEKEQQIVAQLLKNLIMLDKCLTDITARRMQYQKG
jgi:hypothetical protein